MSRNAEIAARFEEFADLLEAKDVEYKPRAYRRAAENIREYPTPIEELAADGQDAVQEIDGVGEALSSKIIAYLDSGEIEELEELRAELPVEMAALTSVEGVGPKTVGALYEALGITTLDELEAAAREGRIADVKGFGPKTEENILENIAFARSAGERELLGDARPLAERVMAYFGTVDAVDRCEPAGSLRRWRATIGDVDVLVGSDDPEAVVDAVTGWDGADEVIEAGTSRASIRVSDMRVDLRVVVPGEFGSALQYFTGSKDHNVHLRNIAIRRDLKMNEYGVFDVSDVEEDAGRRAGERIAGDTEESMYAALDLPWIEPELREDRGEIEAAGDGGLPDLLTEEDVRGDLHVHTDWSDGNSSLEEMVTGAEAFGHDYVCISDHAEGPGVVGGAGLSDADIRDQMGAIREVAADASIEVLAGIEANIDAEGALSTGDDVLADLDIVVASPHSGLDGDGTDRIVAAIEHPHVDVIGHPSGRLLHQRPGLEIDVDRIATAAAEHGVALEMNANPNRLDLWGSAVKTAIDAGATVAINTDAHRPGGYDLVTYGVHTARRGWAEAGDVLNARDVEGLRAFLE